VNSQPAFREEVVFDLGEDQPPIDHTRDGKDVFWFRFYDGGAQCSLVWDGVAGPRFDDFELFDGVPVVFSSDKCHVAWIGRREGRFVIGVDDRSADELSGLDTRFPPALSHDGRRVASLADGGGRPSGRRRRSAGPALRGRGDTTGVQPRRRTPGIRGTRSCGEAARCRRWSSGVCPFPDARRSPKGADGVALPFFATIRVGVPRGPRGSAPYGGPSRRGTVTEPFRALTEPRQTHS